MPPRFLVTTLALLLMCGSALAQDRLRIADGLEAGTIRVGRMTRHFYIHRPPDTRDRQVPTIIALHGGGALVEAVGLARRLKLDQVADRHGFVTVYPLGIGNNWNDARESPHEQTLPSRDVDDVAYLATLIKSLVQSKISDRHRIYVVGASNGGMMAMTLLCRSNTKVAAAMFLIANAPSELAGNCAGRPLPIAIVNGTEDTLIPWAGGAVAPLFRKDRGQVLSTDATIEMWRKRNGCKGKAEKSTLPDISNDGMTTEVFRSLNCQDGASVTLYKINGGGHRYPGTHAGKYEKAAARFFGSATQDFNTADLIWEFFRDIEFTK